MNMKKKIYGKRNYERFKKCQMKGVAEVLINNLKENTSGLLSNPLCYAEKFEEVKENGETKEEYYLIGLEPGKPLLKLYFYEANLYILDIKNRNNICSILFEKCYDTTTHFLYHEIAYKGDKIINESANKIREILISVYIQSATNYSVEMNKLFAEVSIASYIDADIKKIDDGFLKEKLKSNQIIRSEGPDCFCRYHLYKSIKINTAVTLEQLNNIFIDLENELSKNLENLYAEYNNIKETIGGAVVYLDKNGWKTTELLCHKSCVPIINSGFLIYKSPYTGNLVNLRITDFDSIIVEGLDFQNNSNPMLITDK